ncbi:MAG TPA: D-alanyl-D-alanine carboxypeptidase family protein [Candidatus Binataceae bacterium]|nr:D-alanyl-D-alanine carboxypeptidase family protein [Candidatus Binataceae bacterium]
MERGWPLMHALKIVNRSVVLAIAAVMLASAPGLAARTARHERQGHAKAKAEAAPIIPLSQIRVYGNRPAPFALNASAAELMALHSGAVLYAYNEHVKTQPASLAKMMTFYLTLEALRQKRITLETEMPVSEAAWRLSLNDSVSRMFLQVGAKVQVHDLLYGLMVSSGNDAAVVLSEYLGGSTQAFTEQMNKKAAEIGMTETHFTNPDGLPTEDEYTTAADMVKLGRAIVETFPDATQYTSAKDFTFTTTGPDGRTVTIRQRNFNTLLFYDSRVNGIKTGHVQEAGYHLVSSAHSDNLDLISAVFGTSSMEKRRVETDKLLDWAFRTFSTVKSDWHKVLPGQIRVYQGDLVEVPIAPEGGSSYFTVDQGMERKVSLVATLTTKPLVAPLAKGTTVGQLTVMIAGKPESSVPIVTQLAVNPGGWIHREIDSIRMKL